MAFGGDRIATQTDYLIPYKEQEITIGPCNFRQVNAISGINLHISASDTIVFSSGSGNVDFSGASLTGVSGIHTDPDLNTTTNPEPIPSYDDTPADVNSYLTESGSAYMVEMIAVAKDSMERHVAIYTRAAAINSSGVVTLFPMQTAQNVHPDLIGAMCELEITGQTIHVVAVGIPGVTLQWKTKLDVTKCR